MAVANPVTQVLLPAAVAAIMFAVGSTLSAGDMRRVLGAPRGFTAGLLAHTLLLPAVAAGVAVALGLPGPMAVGLVLIASCPASVAANILTYVARGDTMLSVCLTAAGSLASVLTVPLFVGGVRRLFPGESPAPPLPLLGSAVGLFLVSTLPVLAGMRLRHVRPEAARAVERHLSRLGLVVVVLVVGVVVWSERAAVLPALRDAGGPALLTNALALGVGWGTAALAGLPREQRIAVGLECGLQNFGLATFVALTLMGAPLLMVPALAYGLIMWPTAAVVVWLARRGDAPHP
jgi:BASS family bile acid:Na+ symporter